MSKYIIKNCPNYRDREVDYTCTIEAISSDCHNCTDCVLKQIVERCKKVRKGTANICTNPYEYATYCETRGVLELLDIQEVE